MKKFTYHDFLAFFGIGGAHPGGLALTKEVLRLEKIKASSKVLDVGCGTGQTAAYIAKVYNCEVTALDSHPVMLEKAKERFLKDNLRIRLVQGDIMNLPFSDNSFDLVVAESVTIFSLVPKALREYVRVLRHNGILLELEMTAVRPIKEQEMRDFRSFYGIKKVPTETEWCEQMKRAGLSAIQVLKEGTVASTLKKTSLTHDEMAEFNPSESIDSKLYDVWDKHQELTERYASRLGYKVYHFKKGFPTP